MSDNKTEKPKTEKAKKVLVTPLITEANENVFKEADKMRLWGFDFEKKKKGDALVCEMDKADADSFVEAKRVTVVK